MKTNSIEVFINEEYGYRAWKWIPNMTEQEFVAWYKDLTDSDIKVLLQHSESAWQDHALASEESARRGQRQSACVW